MISDVEFQQRLERAIAMAQAPIKPCGIWREVVKPIFPLLLKAGRQFLQEKRLLGSKA